MALTLTTFLRQPDELVRLTAHRYKRRLKAFADPLRQFQMQIQSQPSCILPSAHLQTDLLPVVRAHDSFTVTMTDLHDDETFLLPLHSHRGHYHHSDHLSDH